MRQETSLVEVPAAPCLLRPSSYRAGREGMSLIETLVVLAAIALTLLVAVPAIQTTLANYRTKTAAAQVAMDIRFARNACVKKKIPYTMAINNASASTAPNTYTISGPGLPTIQRSLPAGVEIDDSSITQIDFQALGNCTTLPGSNTARNIDITGKSPYRRRLTVSLSGNVSGEAF